MGQTVSIYLQVLAASDKCVSVYTYPEELVSSEFHGIYGYTHQNHLAHGMAHDCDE